MDKLYIGVGKETKGELIGSGADAEDYIRWYFKQKYPDDDLVNDFVDIAFSYCNDNLRDEIEGWFFSSGDWTYGKEEE